MLPGVEELPCQLRVVRRDAVDARHLAIGQDQLDVRLVPEHLEGVLAAPRKVQPVWPPLADGLRAWGHAAAAVQSTELAPARPGGSRD